MVFNWILTILLALILWSFLERKLLKVSTYTIPTDKVGQIPEDLTIVLLADLHNNTFGKKNRRLVKKIHSLKPDLVVVAGDLITKQQPCIPGNAYDLLKELVLNYPVYYSYGNHEQHLAQLDQAKASADNMADADRKAQFESWVDFKRTLETKGVHFLDNSNAVFNNHKYRIRITGITIDWEYYSKTTVYPMSKDYLEGIAGKNNQKEYQILLAHNPIYFKNYVKWGADLILSGHLHGGLVRLPHFGGIISPQYHIFPKYDSGVFTEQQGSMVVSKGLGSHSVMMRLFNRPELVLIRVSPIK
jgi:predicted MPP superfamily phosphohydrolase